MDDFEMYRTGWMSPDEQEQWDHVTEMMAEAGECDGMVADRNGEDTGDGCPHCGRSLVPAGDGSASFNCMCPDDGQPFAGEEIEF